MSKKHSSKPTSNMAPLILIGGGLVLIISILLWQALASTPPGSSTSPTANINLPYSNVQRVAIVDARAAFDTKSAVFVDVRDVYVYEASHISGALNIPLGVFDAQYKQLDPNQWIITYCTWPSEESSARAASTLLSKGYTKVSALKGGYNAWVQAKYPLEKK